MAGVDRRSLQAYLDRPLDDLMAELELYDPASKGPADVWNKVAGPLRQRLCEEWDYCRVRQDARWDDQLTLALTVAAMLLSPTLRLPIEIDQLLIAAIVVKLGLDAFCACP
jgi:hypothetical protein